MFYVVSHFILTLLAFLVLALLGIFAVSRLAREYWGRVLVGVAFVVLAGWAFLKISDARDDARSACWYFGTAMDMVRFERVYAEYRAAPAEQTPAVHPRVVEASEEILRDENMLKVGPTLMGEESARKANEERFDDEFKATVRSARGILGN